MILAVLRLRHSSDPSIPSFPQSVGRESNVYSVAEQLHGSPITTLGHDDTSPTTDFEDDVQHLEKTVRPRLLSLDARQLHSGMTDLSDSRSSSAPSFP